MKPNHPLFIDDFPIVTRAQHDKQKKQVIV